MKILCDQSHPLFFDRGKLCAKIQILPCTRRSILQDHPLPIDPHLCQYLPHTVRLRHILARPLASGEDRHRGRIFLQICSRFLDPFPQSPAGMVPPYLRAQHDDVVQIILRLSLHTADDQPLQKREKEDPCQEHNTDPHLHTFREHI